MDFTVYRTDLKIAQQIMYVFFATTFQTCTFLFIIGSFFKRGKDLKKAFGRVNKQISVCDIMKAIFFFSSVPLALSGFGTHPKNTLSSVATTWHLFIPLSFYFRRKSLGSGRASFYF